MVGTHGRESQTLVSDATTSAVDERVRGRQMIGVILRRNDGHAARRADDHVLRRVRLHHDTLRTNDAAATVDADRVSVGDRAGENTQSQEEQSHCESFHLRTSTQSSASR
ncbi:hypothetical protein EB077_10340 [bacterium]|nr:hypothetical protein [bacterium]NDC95691.1 hypothetical protein [bacterium]